MLFILLFFVSGFIVGSFLNVIVDRSMDGRSFLTGRSQCDYCKHILAWYDLIPLFSFIFLQGKCRYCKKKLSAFYPISELMTGIVFGITGYILFSSGVVASQLFLLTTLAYFVIISCLLVILLADIKYGIIPFGAVAVGFVAAFMLLMLSSGFSPLSHVLSALGAFLFLFVLTLIRIKGKTAMGMGDAIYALFMGFLLGFPGIVVGMYIAFLTGALFACILVVVGKKKLQGSSIPFGPFLVLGTYIALFWTNEIVAFALRLFLR